MLSHQQELQFKAELSLLVARDTMHHNQYLASPGGKAAAEVTWASGPTPNGNGEFHYHVGRNHVRPDPAAHPARPPPVRQDP